MAADEPKTCFYDTMMKWNFVKGEIVSSEVIKVTDAETIQSVSLQCTLLAQVMNHLSMEFKILSNHIKDKVDESKQQVNSPEKAEQMESTLQKMLFACTVEAMRSGICQHVFELGFDKLSLRYVELMKLKNKMADIAREEEKIKANEANRILAYELQLEKQKVEDLERHLKATTAKLNQLKEAKTLKRHQSLTIKITKG